MKVTIRQADSSGGVCLPGFANTTVIVEAISPTEYWVRKADAVPPEEFPFAEEHMPVVLSEEAARQFLKSLENPPRPNAAARKAAKRFKEIDL